MGATGLGDAAPVGVGGQEAVEFIVTAPEGVDEDPAAVAADGGVEADRRFAVQPHMVGHQAVALPAVELFDDEKILALFLHIFDAFRQRGEKFDGDLFIHKLHAILLVDSELLRVCLSHPAYHFRQKEEGIGLKKSSVEPPAYFF